MEALQVAAGNLADPIWISRARQIRRTQSASQITGAQAIPVSKNHATLLLFFIKWNMN
jgi:hypothetical protein